MKKKTKWVLSAFVFLIVAAGIFLYLALSHRMDIANTQDVICAIMLSAAVGSSLALPISLIRS